MQKQWTKTDDKLLRKNHKTKSGQELAWMLKRPLYAITARARELGLNIDHFQQTESNAIQVPKHAQKIKHLAPAKINNEGGSGSRKKQKMWTPGDIQFLKDNYPTKGAQFVADVLNRSWTSVHYKAGRLRIYIKGRLRWTPQADVYLKQWHGKRNSSEIAKVLGTSAHAIEDRAWVLGLSNNKSRKWTPEEIDYALKSFPHLTYKEIGKKLGRTEIAITDFFTKRNKRKYIPHKWTANEKHLVRMLYNKISIKELSARLNQPEPRVRALTYRMGLKSRNK